jgi:acetyl esterase/lipase
VTVTAGTLGGVPAADITIDGIEPCNVVLYFHGGVYVRGDAFFAADPATQVRRRVRAKVISVDYRLAPDSVLCPNCSTFPPGKVAPFGPVGLRRTGSPP